LVTVKGEPVHLTRIEFDILAQLARNAGRVVTSRMLLDTVWGPEYVGDTQTLRVHVSHVRRKIESPGDVSRYILTEPGVGFRFVELDNG
jgi:DNA-binding response OmpR family regulator